MVTAMKSVLIVLTLSSLLLPAVPPPAHAQVRLSIGAGPAPPIIELCNKLAELISSNIPGVQATSVRTGGGPDNMNQVGSRRIEIGTVFTHTAWFAFHGRPPFATPTPTLRTLTPLWDSPYQLVTIEGTGISTVADLRGKRIGVGPSGSLDERLYVPILRAVGIDERNARIERMDFDDMPVALRERKIDAFFVFAFLGVPEPDVLSLATSPGIRIRLVPLDAALPALQKEFGSLYIKNTIRRESYPGLTADVVTVGSAFLFVVHENFDPNLAYAVTKLIYEKRSDLAQAQKAAQHITLLGVASRSSIPFHPGAIRYFRERGVDGF